MVSDGFWSLSPDPAVPNSQGGQALDQLPPPPRPSSTAPLRLGSDFEVLKVMSWRSDMDQMACTVLEVWNINGVPSNSIYVFRFTLCCDFVLFPMKGYERDNSSDHTCPPDSQHSTAQLFFLKPLCAGCASPMSTDLGRLSTDMSSLDDLRWIYDSVDTRVYWSHVKEHVLIRKSGFWHHQRRTEGRPWLGWEGPADSACLGVRWRVTSQDLTPPAFACALNFQHYQSDCKVTVFDFECNGGQRRFFLAWTTPWKVGSIMKCTDTGLLPYMRHT